jgi:hypothetical protein
VDDGVGVAQQLGQAGDVRQIVVDDRRSEGRQVLVAPRVPDRRDDIVTAACEDPDDGAADEATASRYDDPPPGWGCRIRRDRGRQLRRSGFGRSGTGRVRRLGSVDAIRRRRRPGVRGAAPSRRLPRIERPAQ